MKFYSFKFKGFTLDGVGITQGISIEEAYQLSVEQLKQQDLWNQNQNNFTIDNLEEITDFSQAIILFDGNY